MYNNAALEEEENDEQGRSTLGSRFSRWINNLTGNAADDEAYEEENGSAAPAAAPQPHARSGGSSSSGYGTAYNSRANGGSYGGGSARRDTIRIAGLREGSITVMPVSSFGDIQKAADRLKSGEPQIINLEKCPAEVSERLIDFLNGVTYALDGYVEKISEGAYLFTPSHIAIHADGPEEPAPNPFFDRK
ncbi:MAG TPA: cell division protein SepF [Armatimonadaceae bacterium]|nr:cell division protein SepF [Armatimonadaceae bacterium]